MSELVTINNLDHPTLPDVLPLLPLNNVVLFPAMVLPIAVGGQAWTRLIDEVMTSSKMLAICWDSQAGENLDGRVLGRIGVGARIIRMLRMPDGSIQLLLQGLQRVRVEELLSTDPYPVVRIMVLEEPSITPTIEVEGLARSALDAFQQIVQASPALPGELAIAAANAASPAMLADLITANLNLRPEQQQAVLDQMDIPVRLRTVISYLQREQEIVSIGRKAQEEMTRNQREYVLRQQLEAIRRELGESDDVAAEANELRQRIIEAELPEEARVEAERELKRLERMPAGAADASVVRTYLDWMLSLPWNKSTTDNLDLAAARAVLDADHYGLERIKERIIEYLAVRKLQVEQGEVRARSPILCFVGPPGVGKTSLGQSIARALGRAFARVALGGVRDEAEIRGFRRTYIGALPGRILQAIRRGASNNPVLMLDEIDKLSVGIQGDPAAALLELLDPEQNKNFVDRYLDVAFDMSGVLFICTANRLDTVPGPLLDRMEILELAGYTEQEKVEIARRYLVQRQLVANGLAPSREGARRIEGDNLAAEVTALPADAVAANPPVATTITQRPAPPALNDDALRRLIREYTLEAGVRNLERQIGSVYRKMATRAAQGLPLPAEIPADELDELLGPPRFRRDRLLGEDEVGVVTGLAYTPTGGDVLFIEVSVVPGRGQLLITGQLGEVMQESARAALTVARGKAGTLGIPEEFAANTDIHIHVPAGAVPKDGPSAGVTMSCALISALAKRPAYKHTAMTGEITLHGKVLPIGGVKEKLLAAQRAGVTTVLIPQENEIDLRDVPEDTLASMTIIPITHVDQALEKVLYPVDGGR